MRIESIFWYFENDNTWGSSNYGRFKTLLQFFEMKEAIDIYTQFIIQQITE